MQHLCKRLVSSNSSPHSSPLFSIYLRSNSPTPSIPLSFSSIPLGGVVASHYNGMSKVMRRDMHNNPPSHLSSTSSYSPSYEVDGTPSSSSFGHHPEVVPTLTYLQAFEKEHNPFKYHSNSTFLETMLLGLGTITLLPLRLFFLVVPLPIIGALGTKLILLGADKKTTTTTSPEPLSPLRQRLLRLFLRRITRAFLFGLGFHRITIEGRPASFEEAPILVSNHLSFVDPLFFIARQLPSAIAKDAVAKIPLFGSMARAMQVVFVDRKGKDSRKATIEEVLRRVNYAKENPGKRTFSQVLIFPEGTTTNGSCLVTFKQGAFVPGVPVQPVAIRYPHSHLLGKHTSISPVCAEPSVLSWVPFGPSGLKLLVFMLSHLYNRMEVKYLPVYHPSPEEKADPRLYAANVRNVMAKALGVPVTEHTYDDVLLLTRAFEFKLPQTSINFNLESMKRRFENLNLQEVSALLERFSAHDTTKDGIISPSEFAAALGVPKSEFTQRLFKLFDTDNSGFIDFKEFVVAIAVMSRRVSHEDTIRLAFKAFDHNNDGTISEEDLRNILRSGWKCVTNEEVHQIFDSFDLKHDGKIDYEEFLAFLKQRPEYMNLFGDPNIQGQTTPHMHEVTSA